LRIKEVAEGKFGRSVANSATRLPQRRKINCTLQNARAEKKAAWWAAM